MSDAPAMPVICPRCRKPMRAAIVNTVVWRDQRVHLVEDIPAHVCDICTDQYYDEEVTDALRRLTEDNFPAAEIKREILVPVFSLTGRIKRPSAEHPKIYGL